MPVVGQIVIPIGYCQCGCGQKTKMARRTLKNRGWIEGQPLPYLKHHSGRWTYSQQQAKDAKRQGRVYCRSCKQARPREDFFNRLSRHGVRCKQCSSEACRQRKIKDPEGYRTSLRKANLKANYGISLDEYDKMLIEQGGLCAICRQIDTRKDRHGQPKKLCVDHSHADGRVRGLLCHKCNNALGCLRDSLELLEASIQYLKKYL